MQWDTKWTVLDHRQLLSTCLEQFCCVAEARDLANLKHGGEGDALRPARRPSSNGRSNSLTPPPRLDWDKRWAPSGWRERQALRCVALRCGCAAEHSSSLRERHHRKPDTFTFNHPSSSLHPTAITPSPFSIAFSHSFNPIDVAASHFLLCSLNCQRSLSAAPSVNPSHNAFPKSHPKSRDGLVQSTTIAALAPAASIATTCPNYPLVADVPASRAELLL